MSRLFEQSKINCMAISNRFVRSATWEGKAAPDGSVTDKLIETMTALAEGGVGLIITSHAYVHPEGQAGPWQLGAHTDEMIPGLTKMTDAVHQAGGKIVLQLAHAGFFTAKSITKNPAWVASLFDDMTTSNYREISTSDIKTLVTSFAQAAKRAKAAGFDGVQIHSAHGYLLSQFLSPQFNRREDEYGGAIENRLRIHLEVLTAIREAVGDNYPVMIKINCGDFIENGLTPKDSRHAIGMLAKAGLDAVELSGGVLTGGKLSPSRMKIKTEDDEAYFRNEALAVKNEVDIPLILVGGMRSLEVADKLTDQGVADYISMSRPFIREPGLIKRWKKGDRRRAACISDNQCFQSGISGQGVRCVFD